MDGAMLLCHVIVNMDSVSCRVSLGAGSAEWASECGTNSWHRQSHIGLVTPSSRWVSTAAWKRPSKRAGRRTETETEGTEETEM